MPQTILDTAVRIRSGDITPVDVLNECLNRIDRLETQIHAWVFIDRDGARRQAKQLTDELKRGHHRGPLHGIPIAIKDIFDVFDWPTAAGSELWKNSIARADSTVVKKLRQAGAVFPGKTVTTQWASFDPPVTKNPWNANRTPGGSSSGSAAAVASGMCPGSIGSQTGGSITRPATYCGIAGIKPTFGRVGVAGVLPLAPSMDHPGPMAHTVRDLAILLQVIAGADAIDVTCSRKPVADYLQPIESHNRPPRLGRLRGLFEEMPEESMLAHMDAVAQKLSDAGAEMISFALPASFSEVIQRHRIVMAVECAEYHQERMVNHPDDYLPNIRALIEEGLSCPAPEYARCKTHQHQLQSEIQNCFTNVDVLLAPATTGPAPDTTTTGSPAFNSPWSYTGLPVVSIPTGWSDDGLPLGIQLIGRPWQEAETLAAAAWCEEVISFERKEV